MSRVYLRAGPFLLLIAVAYNYFVASKSDSLTFKGNIYMRGKSKVNF
jgi:hypothetical protein